MTADLEFQTKVYCTLQSLATGNPKSKRYSSLSKLSFFHQNHDFAYLCPKNEKVHEHRNLKE